MSLVEYSLEDHIAVVRLNRPERLNAMSPEMGEELLGYQVVEFAEMRLALRPARFSVAGPMPNLPSGRSGLVASPQRGKCGGVATPAERTGRPYGCH